MNYARQEITPEKIATGEVTANEYFDEEVKNKYNKLVTDPKLKGMPKNEFVATLQKEFLPIIQNAAKVKAGIANIDAGIKQTLESNKHFDGQSLTKAARLKFLDDVMPVDPQTGKRGYSTQVLPDKDYVGEILNSPDRWRYVANAKPLTEAIEKADLKEYVVSKKLRNQGFVPYKIKQSPFRKPNFTPNEAQEIPLSADPQLDIDTEDETIIDDAGNKIPIKVLGKESYEFVKRKPEYMDGLNHLFNSYIERNGIKIPKNQEEKMKRAFAVGIFKDHDKSEVASQEQKHLPRNTFGINIGGSGSGGNDADVLKIFEEIDAAADSPNRPNKAVPLNELTPMAQGVVIEHANKLTGGRYSDDDGKKVPYTQSDIFVRKDKNGKLNIVTYPDGKVLAPLDYKAANFKSQAGVKAKDKVVRKDNELNSKKGSVKKAVEIPPFLRPTNQ
jgi:hypothetical protein